MAQRAERIGVAEGLEALASGLGSEARVPGIESGHGLQERAVEELLVNAPDLASVAYVLGYEPPGELLEDYRRRTRRARAVVERVFYD